MMGQTESTLLVHEMIIEVYLSLPKAVTVHLARVDEPEGFHVNAHLRRDYNNKAEMLDSLEEESRNSVSMAKIKAIEDGDGFTIEKIFLTHTEVTPDNRRFIRNTESDRYPITSGMRREVVIENTVVDTQEMYDTIKLMLVAFLSYGTLPSIGQQLFYRYNYSQHTWIEEGKIN